MKRFLCVLLALFLLTGCGAGASGMEQALMLRQTIQKSNGCSFTAIITADYGEKLYTFTLDCESDSLGNLTFTVKDPQTIAGITGRISQEGSALTFDDKVLAFEPLADELVSPVCAPWLLIKTLRGGYLRACSTEEALLRVVIDDSYEEEALQLDVWVNDENVPVAADILWKGLRVLTLEVRNFQFL